MAHPAQTYFQAFFGRWSQGFLQALVLYGPVHLLPLLIFKPKTLLQSPRDTLMRLFKAIVQSAAFLGTFIGIIWGWIIVLRQVLGRDTSWGPAIGSFTCGLSILLEKKAKKKRVGDVCHPTCYP